MTDLERDKILEALNYKDENGEERKSSNGLWLPLFLSMFTMLGNQSPNAQLEKEVAYLSGKVDTLEKLLLTK